MWNNVQEGLQIHRKMNLLLLILGLYIVSKTDFRGLEFIERASISKVM